MSKEETKEENYKSFCDYMNTLVPHQEKKLEEKEIEWYRVHWVTAEHLAFYQGICGKTGKVYSVRPKYDRDDQEDQITLLAVTMIGDLYVDHYNGDVCEERNRCLMAKCPLNHTTLDSWLKAFGQQKTKRLKFFFENREYFTKPLMKLSTSELKPYRTGFGPVVMKQCSGCGTMIPKDALFCPYCDEEFGEKE